MTIRVYMLCGQWIELVNVHSFSQDEQSDRWWEAKAANGALLGRFQPGNICGWHRVQFNVLGNPLRDTIAA